MKLTKQGITVEVSHKADIAFYKRAGFTQIEEPVLLPAPELAQVEPITGPAEEIPVKTRKKAVKNGSRD